jgi:hypothetical protein
MLQRNKQNNENQIVSVTFIILLKSQSKKTEFNNL